MGGGLEGGATTDFKAGLVGTWIQYMNLSSPVTSVPSFPLSMSTSFFSEQGNMWRPTCLRDLPETLASFYLFFKDTFL